MTDQVGSTVVNQSPDISTEVFQGGVVTPDVTSVGVSDNMFSDLLASITNPQGKPKYSTVEDALKGTVHAQAHISKIEAENEELRTELSRRKTAEEMVEELKKGQIGQLDDTRQATQVDPADVQQLVQQTILSMKQQDMAMSNVQKVITKMTSVYKEQAETRFRKAAEENGMDVDSFNRLAASSPEAVLKLVGIKEDSAHRGAPALPSSINTEALNGQPQSGGSKKVPLTGATTKDLAAAWRNCKPT